MCNPTNQLLFCNRNIKYKMSKILTNRDREVFVQDGFMYVFDKFNYNRKKRF